MNDTQALRDDLTEYIGREDFYDYMPNMQNCISSIESKVASTAKQYREQQAKDLAERKSAIMSLPEWAVLGVDDKNRLGAELVALTLTATDDLAGLRKLINDQLFLEKKLKQIEAEIKKLVEEAPPEGDEHTFIEEIAVPKSFSSLAELNDFITTLEQLRDKLTDGVTLIIKWK